MWDAASGRLFADARFATLCGLDPAEARAGLDWEAFAAGVIADDRLRVRIALAGVHRGSDTFSKVYRVRGADGQVRWVSARGEAEHGGSGALVRFTGVLTDITDQKRVEEQLRVAQTAGGVGSFEHTDGFGTVDVSEQFCRLLGLQPTDSLPVRTINAVGHPDDPVLIQADAAPTARAYAEMRIRRADTGEERWLARRGEHMPRGDGGGGRFVGVIYDITAAKQAEAELRDLARTLEERVEERTRERDRIWNRSRDLFFVMSRDRRYTAVNPAWRTQLGYDEAELIGGTNQGLTHPEDITRTAGLSARLARGESLLDVDTRLKAKNGEYRLINWQIVPEGDYIYGTGRDITDRRALEDQLRQSQKMEAVGQLTGGLAHDFNNMLTGIIGGIDLAQRRIAAGRGAEAARFLEAATAAAERAAALTHRLLAFSRRQTLDPQAVDANQVVQAVEDLLGRTLGEHVQLSLEPAPDLWATRADPNQLENAVLNLAINARDAMPDGGQLSIATANVRFDEPEIIGGEPLEPGDYVVVRVTDAGHGMDEQTLAKVFDPFFTTKPLGQGTGLGLSMVYGFVRQSGGRIDIQSAVGRGTSVSLYLPRFMGEAGKDAQASEPTATPLGGGERVMLVEDDPQVRILVRAVLDDLGYRTVEAVDASQALELLEAEGDLDLLISDVGLPGLNGRQLAEMVRADRPDLPVLFITGYAANVPEAGDMLAPGMRMISKPFALDSLGRTIREMLAGA